MSDDINFDKLRMDVRRLEMWDNPDPLIIRCQSCEACRLVDRRELQLIERFSLVRRHPGFREHVPLPTNDLFQWVVEGRNDHFQPFLVCPKCYADEPAEFDKEEWDEEFRLMLHIQEWIEHTAMLRAGVGDENQQEPEEST